MRRGLLMFLGLIIWLHWAGAQPPVRLQHWGTEEGLSQGTVYTMFQDSRGFMWIGTWDGLNRFDGYSFTVFKPSFSDSQAIKGTFVNSVVEDASGNLWVGTNEALNRYDYAGRIFEHFTLQPGGETSDAGYRIFYIDNEQRLWINYHKKFICIFDTRTKTFEVLEFTRGQLQYSEITNHNKNYFKPVEKIMVVGNEGVRLLYPATRTISNLFIGKGLDKNIQGAEIKAAYADTGNTLWLSSFKGLIRLNIATGESELYDKDANGNPVSGLMGMAPYDSSSFWLGSYGFGVYLFDKAQRKFTRRLVKNVMDPTGLAENIVDEIYTDRDGNSWFGVQPSGLNMFNPRLLQFNMISLYGSSLIGAQNNSAQGITAVDSNTVLASFYQSGLLRYDVRTGAHQVIKLPEFDKEITAQTCYTDNHGNIWAGSDYGLFISAAGAKSFRFFKGPARYDFYDHFIFCPMPQGGFFVGNSEGLYAIRYKEGTPVMDSRPAVADTIRYIVRMDGGKYLYADGTNTLVLANWDGTSMKTEKRIPTPFKIKHIEPQSGPVVWLSTTVGIVVKNIQSGNQQIIDVTSGLSDNYIYATLLGADGHMWASTNNGLNRIDTSNYSVRHFDVSAGLQGKEYNTGSFFKAADGRLFFGGTNGLNYFDPKNVTVPDFDPPIQLMMATINGKQVQASAFEGAEPMRLAFDENNLSFFFTAIDFNRAKSIAYEYQLNGGEWISMGNERFLRLLNLSPGSYALHIKAVLLHGTAGTRQLTIHFIILPPWYKTNMALIAFVLFGVLLLYAAVRIFIQYKVRQQRVLLEKQEAVLRERERIISDLHDDVGGGLSTIRMMSDLMAQQLQGKTVGAASEVFAKKISDTSKDIAQRMHTIIWSLNAENDSLGNFAEYVRQYGISFFEDSPIGFSCAVSPTLQEAAVLNGVQRKALFLTIKEGLHNILKHSGASQARLEIKTSLPYLLVTIADNGSGMANTNPFGNGLKNMRKRMEEIGGSIAFENNNGTQVQLKISLAEGQE